VAGELLPQPLLSARVEGLYFFFFFAGFLAAFFFFAAFFLTAILFHPLPVRMLP
jgi:hypothetical protein